MITADSDGKTCINMYSKGVTTLGRMLSNFYHSPFTHPVHGSFNNIESYWFWLKKWLEQNIDDPEYRKTNGKQAKYRGGEDNIKLSTQHKAEFQKLIREAFRLKVDQNPDIKNALINSKDIPLKHYYQYGERIIELPQYEWICRAWTKLRFELQVS